MTLDQELDRFIEGLPTIASEKRYWLIRTQAGELYETFRENNFIGIEHAEIPLSRLFEISNEAKEDLIYAQRLIREDIKDYYFNREVEAEQAFPKRAGLISNQIFKFIYEIKRGDVVIIPSVNSDVISFGEVEENYIGNFTADELRKHGVDYILKKRVNWIHDVARADVDPFLFKLFFSHQAVNDVSKYADVIERSIGDFFILDDEAHLIIEVQASHKIAAKDLFGLGYDILQLVDEYATFADVNVSSNDLFTNVNINSPGKIDLKSKIKKTTFVAGLILLMAGGGYKGKWGELSTGGLPNLIKSIDDFFTHRQERELKEKMFDHYKDSLHIKDPNDLIKLMKQVSDNKDKPQ
jgi:restriction system protein